MGKNHGQTQTRIYRIWSGMKSRCNNKKNPAYTYYGAKGIRVCDEWENDFLSFKDWADCNGYNDSLTIDRIDESKNYCPENCRWLTREENSARVKFTRDKEKFAQATSSGYRAWYAEHSQLGETEGRIKQINTIISNLPDLGTGELNLIIDLIEWIKLQGSANRRKKEADKKIKVLKTKE